MDLVLDYADSYILTPYVYPATCPEDNAFRQIISLFVITNLGAIVIYFLFAILSYYLLFDHKLKKHPQFLEVSGVQQHGKAAVSFNVVQLLTRGPIERTRTLSRCELCPA